MSAGLSFTYMYAKSIYGDKLMGNPAAKSPCAMLLNHCSVPVLYVRLQYIPLDHLYITG